MALVETGVTIYPKPQNQTEKEWREQRSSYVGASEIPSILGITDKPSKYEVWLRKTDPTNEYLMAQEKEVAQIPQVIMGNLLEDPVARWYAELNGVQVIRDDNIRFHPTMNYFGVNLDRLIVGGNMPTKIMEIKTSGRANIEKWVEYGLSDEKFQRYWCQVQAQMAASGFHDAVLIAVGGSDYFGFDTPESFPIDYDETFEEMILDSVRDFWVNHVEKGIPPEPQSAADVKLAYPKADPNTIYNADVEDVKIALEYQNAHQALKDAEERKEAAKEKLMILLRDKEQLNYNDFKVATFKNNKAKNVFDFDRFKKEYPEQYDACCKAFDESLVKNQFNNLYLECSNEVPGARVFRPVKIELLQSIIGEN